MYEGIIIRNTVWKKKFHSKILLFLLYIHTLAVLVNCYPLRVSDWDRSGVRHGTFVSGEEGWDIFILIFMDTNIHGTELCKFVRWKHPVEERDLPK